MTELPFIDSFFICAAFAVGFWGNWDQILS